MSKFRMVDPYKALKHGFVYVYDQDIKMILRTDEGNVFVDHNNMVSSFKSWLLMELENDGIIERI